MFYKQISQYKIHYNMSRKKGKSISRIAQFNEHNSYTESDTNYEMHVLQ